MSRFIRSTWLGSHWRIRFVTIMIMILGVLLIMRAAYHQIYPPQQRFLESQGNDRTMRTIKTFANRGMILDRHHELLAVSSPVVSLWADPRILMQYESYFDELATALKIPKDDFHALIEKRKERKFIWLKRHLIPDEARAALRLNIPGVFTEREYRRYYPDAEVTSHLLGFTDIEDNGQDGLELSFNTVLTGTAGSKQVLRDYYNRIIEELTYLNPPIPGQNIRLSIDRRLQYLAYRALKASVIEHQAVTASLVLADARTGEILALVNQPAGNPNDQQQRKSELLKNRVVTDTFEPGSTIKPFVVATAIESGKWTPDMKIDTRPGYLRIGRHTVRDISKNGVVTMTQALAKSSNIAMVKIASTIPPSMLWKTYQQLGIGQKSGLGLTGEQSGFLAPLKKWDSPIVYATSTFGYGMTVTALRLAQMYAVLANDGVYEPLQIQMDVTEKPPSYRVFSSATNRAVLTMMEQVIDSGSGRQAAVSGFRIAGKSGTVRKVIDGRYSTKIHRAFFAGIAPVSNPRYVLVVVIDEPKTGKYYGGLVAAPVFSEVMGGALRLLGVEPDQPMSVTDFKIQP